MILIIALCTCYVLITPYVMYTLRSNNCMLGLKSQFSIITCSHLKHVNTTNYIKLLKPVGVKQCVQAKAIISSQKKTRLFLLICGYLLPVTVFPRINAAATILFTEHNLRLQFEGGH